MSNDPTVTATEPWPKWPKDAMIGFSYWRLKTFSKRWFGPIRTWAPGTIAALESVDFEENEVTLYPNNNANSYWIGSYQQLIAEWEEVK